MHFMDYYNWWFYAFKNEWKVFYLPIPLCFTQGKDAHVEEREYQRTFIGANWKSPEGFKLRFCGFLIYPCPICPGVLPGNAHNSLSMQVLTTEGQLQSANDRVLQNSCTYRRKGIMHVQNTVTNLCLEHNPKQWFQPPVLANIFLQLQTWGHKSLRP